MVDRTFLKTQIPHGYGKKIAERAGVTQRAVSLYLTGKTNSVKIEMAALEILSEFKKEHSRLVKRVYE